MAGLFDDLPDAAPQPAAPVYGPGSPVAGQRVTPGQATYMASAPPTGGPPGSPMNPMYAWQANGQSSQPMPDQYVVDSQGQLHVPASAPGSTLTLSDGQDQNDLFGDIPAAPVNPWADFGLTIPASLARGAAGTAHTALQAVESADGLGGFAPMASEAASFVNGLGDKAAHYVAGLFGRSSTPQADFAGALDPERAVADIPGLSYEPKTAAGRVVNTFGEMAPTLLIGPEGASARVAGYLAPAAASAAAGEAAHAWAPEYEGAARVAGAVAGGLGTTAMANPSGDLKVIRAATEGMTPEQIARAQAVRTAGEAMGSPVTLPEAAAYAAPDSGADALAPVQRQVEMSRTGAPIMAPVMTARPAAQRQAVQGVLDQIAPATPNPSSLAGRSNTAATAVLDRTRQAVNATARPMYDASAGDLIAPSDYAALAQHPSWQAALQSVRGDPELSPGLSAYPENSIAVTDAVIKRLNDMATAARGTALAPGDLQLAQLRQQAADLGTQIATRSSPAYGAARAAVASGRAAQLAPLEAGATGLLSKAPTVDAATSALFPSAPLPGQAGETAQAISGLNGQDDGLSAALLRAHLGKLAGETMQDGASGPVANGGKFIAAAQGNPLQREVLDAGFAGAAPQAKAGFDSLSDVLTAQALRQPTRPVLQEEMARQLKAGKVDGFEGAISPLVGLEATHNPVGLAAPIAMAAGGKVWNALQKGRVNANAGRLAKTFTGPADQTGAVIEGARTAADRQRAALAQALFAGTTAASSGSQ